MARRSLPTISCLGAVIFGVVLFAAIVGLFLAFPPGPPGPQTSAAVITLIPAPSATIPGTTPTPLESPTPTFPPPAGAGSITVGNLVQIAGTGGDGLRLRVGPSLEDEVRFLGLEAEVFEVIDGPVEADGYSWFLLLTPLDETRQGWAVSSFLVTVENP